MKNLIYIYYTCTCRHSVGPRFTSWPANQVVCEGDTVTVECGVENCSSVVMSRHFVPVGTGSI